MLASLSPSLLVLCWPSVLAGALPNKLTTFIGYMGLVSCGVELRRKGMDRRNAGFYGRIILRWVAIEKTNIRADIMFTGALTVWQFGSRGEIT